MSKEILNTTKNLNNLIKQPKTDGEVLNDILNLIQNSTNTNACLVTKKGKVMISGSGVNNYNNSMFIKKEHSVYLDNKISAQISKIKETKSNFKINGVNGIENCNVAVLPIHTGKTNASMILWKKNKDDNFSENDLINSEICANSASLIMRQSEIAHDVEDKMKQKAVESLISTLSLTERDVLSKVFAKIDYNEGFIIASKIADESGYARSVTVNALRKLESAGVIFTRSLGVKGTYIKVLNDQLPDAMRNLNKLS